MKGKHSGTTPGLRLGEKLAEVRTIQGNVRCFSGAC